MTTKIVTLTPSVVNPVDGSGPGGICLVIKDLDESRTSTIVRTVTRNFSLPLGPNERWIGQILLLYNGPTNADISMHLEAPVGASGSWGVIGLRTTGPSFAGEFSALCKMAFDAGDPIELGTAGVSDNINTIINFVVQNGANSGNLNFFWAQRVSQATPTIIRAGSFITAHRL